MEEKGEEDTQVVVRHHVASCSSRSHFVAGLPFCLLTFSSPLPSLRDLLISNATSSRRIEWRCWWRKRQECWCVRHALVCVRGLVPWPELPPRASVF